MNIQEAKRIPLQVIVERLGGRYSHTDRRGDFWFFSPFRPEEKTASFKVNTKYNTWHDFGLSNTGVHRTQGSGGDIFDLWCDYHFKDRKLGFKEAFNAINDFNFNGHSTEPKFSSAKKEKKITIEKPRYRILKMSDRFTHVGLLTELDRRRISKALASIYLKQGNIEDTLTGKKYWGFLFENDKGGFELSIPNPQNGTSFKSCIGPKASSRILVGDDVNSADIFEGFWDFLTWLQMKAKLRPINHSYILNSTSLTSEVCDKIIAFSDTIKYVFLFMDNDEAGFLATHAAAGMLEETGIKAGSMEYLYDGFKDLSDYRMGIRMK